MLDMTVILQVPERENKFFFASFIAVLTGFFFILSTCCLQASVIIIHSIKHELVYWHSFIFIFKFSIEITE